MAKRFLDTNILAYQLDSRYPKKQARCREVAQDAARTNDAVISTQVLQEFYVAATAKLRIDAGLVKAIVQRLENMEVVTITTEMINEAIDISVQSTIAFWDALIVSAAASANCETILSEDMGDGQNIKGVRIQNPMK